MPPRLLAWVVLFASTGLAAAQSGGPQLLTVTPPGAKVGTTTDVTVSGTALDGAEALLFSDPRIKAELVGEVAVEADKVKAKGGGKAAAPKATGAFMFKVTVPDAPNMLAVPTFDVTDVRVVTKAGLSNPRSFSVGGLTEVAEAEPNNDVPEAQKIELNTTVNGVIVSATDVDYVAFKADAGQNVVVSCLTTTLDSKLQADLLVAGPDGKVVAANRGYRGGDALLDFKAPAAGEYVVRVSQFAYTSGGSDHFYRLSVTTRHWADAVFPPWVNAGGRTVYGRNLYRNPDGLSGPTRPDSWFARPDGRPFDTDTLPPGPVPRTHNPFHPAGSVPPPAAFVDFADFPRAEPIPLLTPQANTALDNDKNDTPETAQPISVPCDVAGRIDRKNDRDWYSFTAKKGDVLTLEVFAERIGAPVDAFMVLTDDAGKVIAEVDDSPDTLSPNQFYTRSDDPGRYRFEAKADGTYRVMVSTREAAIQAGVRDVYVLRVAPETPDFRLAVMPLTPHLPEGVSVPRGGATQLTVYVGRFDGFDGPITLTAENLPPGVACPPQVVGPGLTKATLVLTAGPDAKDWAGFVMVKGAATIKEAAVSHAARPFSVTWAIPGQGTQIPATPVLSRLDRGPGLALAVRGEAAYSLAVASDKPLTAKPGDKLEVTLKLTRGKDVKDAVQVQPGSFFLMKRDGGNTPPAPLATFEADKDEVKVSVDVPDKLPAGTYSVVFRGVVPDAAAKGGGNNPKPPKSAYPSVPVAVEVVAKEVPAKKKPK